MFRQFTTVKVVFIKLSIVATSHCFSRKCPYKYSKQYLPGSNFRIVSVGSVSTLIESVLSNEWQFLKNKTGMYTESNHDFKMCDAFGTYP